MKLLVNELQCKRRTVKKLQCDKLELLVRIEDRFSLLDAAVIQRFVCQSVTTHEEKTKAIHSRKLARLGIENELEPCDPHSYF